MYQEKGFKTIFDDVKAKPILSANIKEDEVIKPTKSFSINDDKLDFSLIVDDYKLPSFKYIDDDSTKLRYPVFQNRKSAIDVTQITTHPGQVFINNPDVSPNLNNYYEQATTINLPGQDYQSFPNNLDPTNIMLGQKNYGLDNKRYINRWDVVDPRVVQNVDNIVMNMKGSDGHTISLFSCGISTRNELRNYVEVNNC